MEYVAPHARRSPGCRLMLLALHVIHTYIFSPSLPSILDLILKSWHSQALSWTYQRGGKQNQQPSNFYTLFSISFRYIINTSFSTVVIELSIPQHKATLDAVTPGLTRLLAVGGHRGSSWPWTVPQAEISTVERFTWLWKLPCG